VKLSELKYSLSSALGQLPRYIGGKYRRGEEKR